MRSASRSLMPLLGLCLSVSHTSRAFSADPPVAMATEARVDIAASDDVEAVEPLVSASRTTRVERQHWLPAEKQARGGVATIPVVHYAWRAGACSFIPKASGRIRLDLRGPWAETPETKQRVRQWVDFADVKVTGAEFEGGATGRFGDSVGKTSGWTMGAGARVVDVDVLESEIPKQAARVWHDAPATAWIRATAGQKVTIQFAARAHLAPPLTEMPRLTGTDSPAHRALKRFARGVNFGNYLEVPPDQNWSLPHDDTDFARAKQAGFDHVRLPIGWHHYCGPAPEFTIKPDFFARIDRHVDSAERHGLRLLINVHHFDEFTTNPPAHRAQLLAIWKQVAERYQRRSDDLAFEILNEPKDAASTEVMSDVYAEAIPLIRRTNPERTLFIGPGKWNTVGELGKLRLPADDRLIVTLHTYEPFRFTHQGAPWLDDDVRAKGIRFPGPPTTPLEISPSWKTDVRAWIERYNVEPAATNPCSPGEVIRLVEQAREWSEYYGRPIHWGEFGAYVEADATSRGNYLRTVRQAAEERNMGWALWDWKAGFRFWDGATNRAVPEMDAALFERK